MREEWPSLVKEASVPVANQPETIPAEPAEADRQPAELDSQAEDADVNEELNESCATGTLTLPNTVTF